LLAPVVDFHEFRYQVQFDSRFFNENLRFREDQPDEWITAIQLFPLFFLYFLKMIITILNYHNL